MSKPTPRRRHTARERILAYVASRATGATRAEIVRATGIKENTVNPRVNELLNAEALTEIGVRGDRGVLVVV
jgi:Fic family protein